MSESRTLIAARQEQGLTDMLKKEIPWYFEAHERIGYEEFYLRHYRELSTERMIEGYFIPRSRIKAYGIDDLGLEGEDLDIFIRMIRDIDEFLIQRQRDKDDKKMKQQQAQMKAQQNK